MRWLSVDPATHCSGLALWDGDRLVDTGIVKSIAQSERRRIEWRIPRPVDSWVSRFTSPAAAWDSIIATNRIAAIVLEHSFSPTPKSTAAVAFMRGQIAAVAALRGARFEGINTSSWRKCTAEAWGCSWTSAREEDRLKALSQSLVREHFGVDVTGDEADAVLVGFAALRMRIVDIVGPRGVPA